MLDALDRELIHALHIDGRAPFSRIGQVLGTSAQTVTRRYRRLRAEAGLHVVGLPDPNLGGQQQWIVRLTAGAATAQDIARALTRRPDTSWVRLTSGGTEIVAIITTPTQPNSLLLRDIPRTSSVTAVSAHCLLHLYLGGPGRWSGSVSALTAEQVAQLQPPAPSGVPVALGAADRPLMAALLRDGRASYAELAEATGWSQSTVARRLAELRSSGTVFLDVDVDSAVMGVTTQAVLWMSVAPIHLDSVARELAGHPELAVVAATTGPTNLMAHALCADPHALHVYLTRRLALESITRVETAPVLRTLKFAGPTLS